MTTPGISTQNQSRTLTAAPSRVVRSAADRVEGNTALENRVQQQAVANRVAPNHATSGSLNIAA